ncbi:MAG TPA: TcdA/TcdB catalytic glycosyltransferase domain-containing protein, partial [Pseudonocardiaceae bacterium]|nr:TcdA/TcdB catalytic glycosyltransferase domain-containing protein [Pseudonocardiaceae bacterium]
MPLLFHSIWLGSPLTDSSHTTRAFRNNVAHLADQTRGSWRVLVWTDIPRNTFAQAVQAAQRPAAGPDPHAGVRQMLDWARDSNVLLINVDEVFHAGALMPLAEFYRMELAKQLGLGFAAASDILRLAILERFGGIYTDGDNRLVSLDGLQDVFHRHGFGTHFRVTRDRHSSLWGMWANSVLLAARQHPFPRRYLDVIERNYALTQADLLGTPLAEQQTRGPDAEWATVPWQTARRNSVLPRTGPFVLEPAVGIWAGRRDAHQQLPRITEDQIKMGGRTSWQSRSPLEPARQYDATQVAEVTRGVVATLIRELYNREGDLHLTYVAPVVAGLPNPDAAWRAVITFILSRPGLPRITTVTDRILHPGDGEAGTTVHVVDLPADLRATLGLGEVPPGQDPPGIWRLAELMRPVTPPRPVGQAAVGDSADATDVPMAAGGSAGLSDVSVAASSAAPADGAVAGAGGSGDVWAAGDVGPLTRLADWIGANEVISDGGMDCVQRAWDAFDAMHERRVNRSVDDGVLSDAGLPGLLWALGGVPEPVDDSAVLWEAIRETPRAMALVVARPRDGQRAHVFWLVADDRTGTVVPRWVDTQDRGVFDRPAPFGESDADWRAQELRMPDTRVLVLDGDGRPTTAARLLGAQPPGPDQVSGYAAALLDPPTTGRRPGAIGLRVATRFPVTRPGVDGSSTWLQGFKLTAADDSHSLVLGSKTFWRADDGTVYVSEEEVRAAGKQVDGPVDLNTLQFVSSPIAVFPGDGGRQIRSEVFQRLLRFDLRLGDVRSGPVRLETLFPSDQGGYDVYRYSGNALDVTVADVVVGRPAGFDVNYTVGVPVEDLFVFLSRVRDGGWLGGSTGVGAREHLADGLMLGTDVAGRFAPSSLAALEGRGVPDFAVDMLAGAGGVAEVRGYLALVYTQAAALLQRGV